jgi:hypothetical protein
MELEPCECDGPADHRAKPPDERADEDPLPVLSDALP